MGTGIFIKEETCIGYRLHCCLTMARDPMEILQCIIEQASVSDSERVLRLSLLAIAPGFAFQASREEDQ